MYGDLAAQAVSGAGKTQTSGHIHSSRKNVIEYCLLGLFSGLLALVTLKHEMYLDEAQAWLIARDSRSLFELFHHLHYEAHPALWYLLLYFPAHISSNMACMQCINYALSVVMAWLILSERKLPIVIRVLLVFSLAVFFTMGVLARSYMLAGVLLVAASRCFLAEPRRHWLAVALLALAINTHFLAIPIAATIFIWLYCLAPNLPASLIDKRRRDRQFWISVTILAISTIVCYFSIRPAADIYLPQYRVPATSPLEYLVLGIGKVWRYFLPFDLQEVSRSRGDLAGHFSRQSVIDACVTFGLWMLALAVLPGRRSRWFMITGSVLWMAAVAVTVHIPLQTHSTFLSVSYVIALMINAGDSHERSWIPLSASQPVLLMLLSIQVSLCIFYCVLEWQKPFSGSQSTAMWLKSSGLDLRTLVIEPQIAAPAILGHTGVESAYFPGCQCRGSVLVYRKGWDSHRQISLDELQALNRDSGSIPVVISNWQLTDENVQQLRLRLRYASPHGFAWDHENLFVYVYEATSPLIGAGMNQ
jgi:hypothetical protein